MKILAPQVLAFWFGSGADYGIPQKRWFEKDPAFDAEVRTRFSALHQTLSGNREWLGAPAECLALAAARHAIDSGYDRGWLRVEKIFAYLPFEHSESLDDQERACDLMRPLGDEQYDYALRHKAIIERFGRFPHRNAVLGRESTSEEIEFLKQPGSGF